MNNSFLFMPRRARTPSAYQSQAQVQGKASSDNEIEFFFFFSLLLQVRMSDLNYNSLYKRDQAIPLNYKTLILVEKFRFVALQRLGVGLSKKIVGPKLSFHTST